MFGICESQFFPALRRIMDAMKISPGWWTVALRKVWWGMEHLFKGYESITFFYFKLSVRLFQVICSAAIVIPV